VASSTAPSTTAHPGGRTRDLPAVLILAVLFCFLLLLHAPLLRLPYIWDEAGYYIPAARDLLLTGSLIPRTTVSNAHPPLVMAWVALAWKIFGFKPLVTRMAMLLVAAFALLGVYRLGRLVANRDVATVATLCTALYPVFFTQSSLAQLDLAAAGLTLWGLHSYLQRRQFPTFAWFALAGLAKETAILAPVALIIWESVGSRLVKPYSEGEPASIQKGRFIIPLLLSLFPLLAWFAFHYLRKGYVFGNPEFFRYNVGDTLHPVRILLAAGMRIWHVAGYMHLWLLTAAAGLAMFRQPEIDPTGIRPRICIPAQLVFGVLIAAYVCAMSLVGGAVLARYMLPVLPLVIILCVSTVWRRVRYWKAVLAIVVVGFAAGLFVNPPYGFSFEDNLAYRDYILLHKNATDFLVEHYPSARILTAWPASDEIARPYLGYTDRPMHVIRIENFSLPELQSAGEFRSNFEVALVFSTKYVPPQPLLPRWPAWERLQARYFGFHRDLPPPAAAQILGGRLAYSAVRNGQWVGVIELQRAMDAESRLPPEN
jgi:4-amino-4-deoxy-L-arabinose transferase-like glycosyltransferase